MTNLTESISKLKELQKEHIAGVREMLEADNGNIFPFDIFVTAVYKRSMSLIDGFIKTIPDNFFCAAPLIRLQLDNALRVSAANRVNVNIHEFATDVLNGKSIRSMQDRETKQKLQDRVLVDQLKQLFPEIEQLYKETSGYIHFSEKHILNTISIDSTSGKISAHISDKDKFITDGMRVDAVDSMLSVTNILLWQLGNWTFTKNNPVLAKKVRDSGFEYIKIKEESPLADEQNESLET